MANVYSQISIHVVFAVKGRNNFIATHWRDRLFSYIAGTINGLHKEAKSLAVGGWKDHVHILFGLPPAVALSDFVGKVKSNSSTWINKQKLIPGRFEWQTGYSAFSYSQSQRNNVIKIYYEPGGVSQDKNF